MDSQAKVVRSATARGRGVRVVDARVDSAAAHSGEARVNACCTDCNWGAIGVVLYMYINLHTCVQTHCPHPHLLCGVVQPAQAHLGSIDHGNLKLGEHGHLVHQSAQCPKR